MAGRRPKTGVCAAARTTPRGRNHARRGTGGARAGAAALLADLEGVLARAAGAAAPEVRRLVAKALARDIDRLASAEVFVGPPEARPADGLAIDFVVESDRAQLSEIVRRVRDGRLRTNIGNVATLDDAVAALNSTERRKGKTIISVRP